MIQTFDTYIRGPALEKAMAKYGRTNIRPVIADAAQGNADALNLLFFACRQVIAATFFKKYLGDRKFWAKRIKQGDDVTWAGEVYARLQKTAEAFINAPQNKRLKSFFDNPAASFGQKPGEKKRGRPAKAFSEAEVLKSFQGYLYMRLWRLAVQLNTTEKRQGITGLGSYDKDSGVDIQSISNAGPQEGGATDMELDSSLSGGASFENEIETKMVFDSYLSFLKRKDPRLYQLVLLNMGGAPREKILDKMGIDNWTYNKLLRDAKSIYNDFVS